MEMMKKTMWQGAVLYVEYKEAFLWRFVFVHVIKSGSFSV